MSLDLMEFNFTHTSEFELLSKWKAICENYSQLHEQSYIYYKRLNNGLMIPIITLSTCGGSINVILSLQHAQWYYQLCMGFFGLFVGLLSGIYNCLNVPEYQEKHDIFSHSFDQLARTIDMELVLFVSKNDTYSSLQEFIKIVKSNLDKLTENAPSIPEFILVKMNEKTIEIVEHSIWGSYRSRYTSSISNTNPSVSNTNPSVSKDAMNHINKIESTRDRNRRDSRKLLRDSILNPRRSIDCSQIVINNKHENSFKIISDISDI